MSTMHCTLKNEANLYVNEHQKVRQYNIALGLLKKEEMPNGDFSLPAVRT